MHVMLMSLPASIPAGFLSFLLVMVFLGYGGGGTVLHQAIAGATLVVSSLVAALPVGVLLFYRGVSIPKKPKLPVTATSLIESLSNQDERTMGGEDIGAMDEVIASSTSQEVDAIEEGFDLGGFGEFAGDMDEVGEALPLDQDDAFEGIVEEITETDEGEAIGELEEISDFDDLFGEEKKA
jgi:hypothetical protein